MNVLLLLNPENVPDAVATAWPRRREGARVIVTDSDGNIALFHATKHGYYKLPGGGIDPGETPEEAARRECREEIGCEIEVTGELGQIVEYRKKYELYQTSYCFIARLVGEKGQPHLEPDEADEGFVTEWLPLDEAIARMKAGVRDRYESQFFIPRETAFLEAYKNRLG